MLLALMKRLPQYRDQQRQAQWRDLGQARSLLDAEVLMVGTGDLGTSFARLCRALGAHTTGVRRDPARPAQGIQRIYGLSELDELLPRADVVALALPQSPKTVGLFGRERLLRQEIPFGVHDYPIPWVLTEAGLFEDGTPSRLE